MDHVPSQGRVRRFVKSGKQRKVNECLLSPQSQALYWAWRIPLGISRQFSAKCPVPSFGPGHLLRVGTAAPWAAFPPYQAQDAHKGCSEKTCCADIMTSLPIYCDQGTTAARITETVLPSSPGLRAFGKGASVCEGTWTVLSG